MVAFGVNAQLDVGAPVLRVGADTLAAALQRVRRRLIVTRQRPRVAIRYRDAALDVVARLPRADDRVSVPALDAATGGRDRSFSLERFRRLHRDHVDGAAHRTGAVEHGRVAFLDLNGGDIGREEPGEVEAVVGRQVDAHAVHHQRHLLASETAHEDVRLVAPSVRIEVADDAGHQVDRLVQAVPLERLHLLVRDDRSAHSRLARILAEHVDDLAKPERAVAGGGRLRPLRGRRLRRRSAGLLRRGGRVQGGEERQCAGERREVSTDTERKHERKYRERSRQTQSKVSMPSSSVADDWRFAAPGRKLRRLGPQQPLQLGFCQLQMVEVAVEGPDVAR